MGTALGVRGSQPVRLTEAGEQFRESARVAVGRLLEARASFSVLTGTTAEVTARYLAGDADNLLVHDCVTVPVHEALAGHERKALRADRFRPLPRKRGISTCQARRARPFRWWPTPSAPVSRGSSNMWWSATRSRSPIGWWCSATCPMC